MAGPNPAAAWRGVVLAAIVAVGFAMNSSLAGVAYAGGSNALSVLLMRSGVACTVLFIVLHLHRVRCALPPRKRYAAMGLGVLLGAYSYGVLGAIEYLPVALAIVTFYTYPILVALLEWLAGEEPFRLRIAVSLTIAFGGIVLALDIVGAHPNLRGVSMAFLAAIAVSVMMVISHRVRGSGDSRPITLHMLGTAFVGFAIAALWSGHFAFPNTGTGWAGFIGAPVFYTFSIIALFEVMSMIGPLRAALVMNVEPVVSVLLGFLLLGQRLSALQLVGVALVIGAVILVEVSRPTH
jgi:drug/metabolite transporter (DMT)-like permease